MSTSYFPIFLKLEGRPCVVVGAGRAAVVKLAGLLEANASVTVIAPVAEPEVRAWADEGRIRWLRREYREGDLEHAYLVIAATNYADVNRAVYDEAQRRRVIANVVDTKPLCDYITPAVIHRDGLTIALSTAGLAPALASVLRRRLEHFLDDGAGHILQQAQLWRRQITRQSHSFPEKKAAWYELIRLRDSEVLGGRGNGEISRLEGRLSFEPRSTPNFLVAQDKPFAISVLGFDQWHTTLDVLEKLKCAFPSGVISLDDALAERLGPNRREVFRGIVLLNTCHRFEVYLDSSQPTRARRELEVIFATILGVACDEVRAMTQWLQGVAAVGHLARVTAGLESIVLLEREIQGQVRRAMRRAGSHGTISPRLEKSFQFALGLGRISRRRVALTHNRSLSTYAIEFVRRRLPDIRSSHIAVLGSGPFAKSILRALDARGIHAMGLTAPTLTNLRDGSSGQPIVIFAAARTKKPLINRELARHLVGDADRKLVVMDIALPRNVAQDVRGLYGVTVWDIEDLCDPEVIPGATAAAGVDEVRELVVREVDRWVNGGQTGSRTTESHFAPLHTQKNSRFGKPASKRGQVILVGAGPGDPGLLTVRGQRALMKADAVLYDRLISPDLLATAPANCRRISVGKDPTGHHTDQDAINRLLVELAREGLTVVRLKGGDPFIFGRGAEEVEYLKARGIDCEVIPGVSSVTGVPTDAGISLTHRHRARSFAVVTAKDCSDPKASLERIRRLARAADSLVILMGMSRLREIIDDLLKSGTSPNTPIAIIESGSTPSERRVVGTLSDLDTRAVAASLGSPGLIIIGEAVRHSLDVSAILPSTLSHAGPVDAGRPLTNSVHSHQATR